MAGIAAQIIEKLMGSGLPEALPPEPMGLLIHWHDEARSSGRYADPNAMALATCTSDARPSVRMVLCKEFEREPAAVIFYTNMQSRKGDELAGNPWAAAVFHWPHLQRQARVEGPIERVSQAQSDAYFASRSVMSRLGAWASQQSRPMHSRAELVQGVIDAARRFGISNLASLIGLGQSPPAPSDGPSSRVTIPRPDYWGGYRIKAQAVELWVGGEGGRLHDRARWTLNPGPHAAPTWNRTRLFP